MAILKLKTTEPVIAETFLVQSLEELSPTYAALVKKQREIHNEINQIRAETEAVKNEILEHKANPTVTPQQQRVAEILGDEIAPKAGAELPTRLQALTKRRSDLDAAQVELTRRISEERGRASRLVCDQVRDHHKQLVKNICEKLLVLHEAHIAYAQFTNALSAEDVAWTALHPMFPSLLGNPHDNQSRAALYLREAAQNGFISRDDIPKELR
ncbi:hypothetical protein DC522_01345 [Microvirga sp. KLBC 81]|uniref:hypothetical protein n=1 Tax=Microvirga sp. KLBC 81 TaxID=1862707 RepID=UPI000D51031C|nr:hypothetical protein [Microvirga sp. KLBC 81]PVE26436.1 hypothetical protein DC522_01345 [Microvirga sp. KLBC 81]